ncbi:2-C-methyl-D-erythritol 4-phosphate cytidylyltransferase [Thiohalorhabdus methylotrophus]|uniref:2-C-methyl-D-erythritol 4-phosphate cytidylyltransferase n=1 Tax=Thiohalorhabdus methylotrophus TaxID=3242694 RepID=A0ABV4TZL3_9GAMM
MPDTEARRVWAIVPAAGIGSRMGSERPKQYLELAGRTILEHTLERLLSHGSIHAVLPVIRPDDPFWPEARTRLAMFPNLLPEAPGGDERQESVANGVEALNLGTTEDLVLIHDAVRPCIGDEEIHSVVAAADECGGAILAVPVADTLKRVAADGCIEDTVDRSGLWRAQTPQVFRHGELEHALEVARTHPEPATDEASILERAGYPVRVVPGRDDNLKVTRPEDLALAELFLGAR